MVVTEHQVVAVLCACGQVSEGSAPVGITGRARYGAGVKAAAVYRRGAQVPAIRAGVAAAGRSVWAPVSTGFGPAVVAEAARRLGPFISHMAALLHEEKMLHADETPARVDGGSKYVPVACTAELTLFHVGGRGRDDVDAGGGAARLRRHHRAGRVRRLRPPDRGRPCLVWGASDPGPARGTRAGSGRAGVGRGHGQHAADGQDDDRAGHRGRPGR